MSDDSTRSRSDAAVPQARERIEIPPGRRVFGCRDLRLESIDLVGFDMDYTLAAYHHERLEELAIRMCVQKLVSDRGYPNEIIGLDYNPAFAIRGLVIDRAKGNVLKLDRHNRVRRARHGTRELDRAELNDAYERRSIRLKGPGYVWIDTQFALPQAILLMALVDYFEKRGDGPGYDQLYADLRSCLDEAHANASIQTIIRKDSPGYIRKDRQLPDLLNKLRSAGKRLFLLTNSWWPYTNGIMSYLLDRTDTGSPAWRDYFDFVLVGAGKPGFFAEGNPFYEVDLKTEHRLPNTATELLTGRVYERGNIVDFEQMTGTRGDRVLYIGDHIYGDVIRLKKQHMWRTALILEELESEIATGQACSEDLKALALLDRRTRTVNSEIDYQVLLLNQLEVGGGATGNSAASSLNPSAEETRRQLQALREQRQALREEVDSLQASVATAFNPFWGSVFREGNESSRFGDQVQQYADIYTSKVGNLLSYSPLRYFLGQRRLMPHES